MGFAPLDFIGNLLGIDSSAGEKQDLTAQFAKMRQAIEAYRPMAARARMAGLGNILSPGMVNPINDQLAHMYGDSARFDTNALLRNPLAEMAPPPGLADIRSPAVAPAPPGSGQNITKVQGTPGGSGRGGELPPSILPPNYLGSLPPQQRPGNR